MLNRTPDIGALTAESYAGLIERLTSKPYLVPSRREPRALMQGAERARRQRASGGRLRVGTLAPLLLAALAGCATQGPYKPAALEAPAVWSVAASVPEVAPPRQSDWWHQLYDPAIDTLVEAALADSPTVAQAIARVDEARAHLGVTRAQQMPSVVAQGGFTRSRSLDSDAPSGGTQLISDGTAGLGLSWEIDLFGRVRHSAEAGRLRVEARDADAKAARLVLAAQISDGVLALRACDLSLAVLQADIVSRETTLALTRLRLETGFVAPVEESRALSGLAAARTAAVTRAETCARNVNALVALSGQPREAVRALTAAPAATDADASGTAIDVVSVMPQAPRMRLVLPATVLAAHPSVMAAEREAAAAWSDIAVARAERLPRIDLAAALSGEWLRAAGQSVRETIWSIGPSVSLPLFDGGSGAANVSAAEARYRAALANLRIAVRTAAQDVEDALAAIDSATQRRDTTLASVAAARRVLEATQAQWDVGAASQFEVEDARRELSTAQDAAITAAHDGGRAWIALVRACGDAAVLDAGGVMS